MKGSSGFIAAVFQLDAAVGAFFGAYHGAEVDITFRAAPVEAGKYHHQHRRAEEDKDKAALRDRPGFKCRDYFSDEGQNDKKKPGG